MKNLLFLISFITCSLHAQEAISFSVYQDVKLAFFEDDAGNNPFTTNLIFNVDLEGRQFEWYYFSIKLQYEFANLHGGNFYRYSVNTGWNFNKLVIPKLDAGIYVGLGIINRGAPIKKEGFGSYSVTGQLSYPIYKNLSVSTKLEIVRRSDLVYWYNTSKPFTPNVSLGLKYKI